MDFKNGKELLALCSENGMRISEVMYRRELTESGAPLAEVDERMRKSLEIMKKAAVASIEEPLRSMGGLIGGEAKKAYESACKICGPILSDAIAYAMSVLEVNATMGLIVAAPTAGSSGVLPGVLRERYREDVHSRFQRIDGEGIDEHADARLRGLERTPVAGERDRLV